MVFIHFFLQKTLMARENPPPSRGKCHFKFPFFYPSRIHVPFVLFLALLLFHTCTYILRAQILVTGGTALDAVTEAVSQ